MGRRSRVVPSLQGPGGHFDPGGTTRSEEPTPAPAFVGLTTGETLAHRDTLSLTTLQKSLEPAATLLTSDKPPHSNRPGTGSRDSETVRGRFGPRPKGDGRSKSR